MINRNPITRTAAGTSYRPVTTTTNTTSGYVQQYKPGVVTTTARPASFQPVSQGTRTLTNITNNNISQVGMPTTYKKVLATNVNQAVVTTKPSTTYLPTATTTVTNVARPVVASNTLNTTAYAPVTTTGLPTIPV